MQPPDCVFQCAKCLRILSDCKHQIGVEADGPIVNAVTLRLSLESEKLSCICGVVVGRVVREGVVLMSRRMTEYTLGLLGVTAPVPQPSATDRQDSSALAARVSTLEMEMFKAQSVILAIYSELEGLREKR